MTDPSYQIDVGGNDLIINHLYTGATGPGQAGTLFAGAGDVVTLDTIQTITAAKTFTGSVITAPGLTSATNLALNATGTGTIAIGNVSTGAVTITPATTITGVATFTAAPVFSSAIASATITTLTSTTANITSVVSPTNLTLNATSTGTIGIGSVSTGAVTITPATTVTGLLTANGGVVHGAGTATVAPIVLTSGTNLTTAAAGAVEFDGTAFYATSVASSRQQVDAEQFAIATANSATYSNTGLDTASAAPVFTSTTNSGITNGTITLAAGKTYAFEAVYNLTNTGTTSHTWATLFGGSASFSTGSSYQVFGNSGTTANTPVTGGLTGFFTGTTLSTAVVCTAASTSATEQVSIQMNGVLVVNGAGTLIPQLKASARPGATGVAGVILLAGSYFRIWEMGTNNFVGNWG